MKLLMIEQYRDIGGGQTVFLQVLAWALERGCTVTIALPFGGALEHTIRERYGERVEYIDFPERRLTSGKKSVGDVVRLAGISARILFLRDAAAQCEYVYVSGARLYPGCLLLSSLVRARFVYHLHLDHSRLEKSVIGALLRHPRTHVVIANSSFVLRRLREALGDVASAPHVQLIENSLSDSFVSRPFVDRWRSPQPLRVVSIGRVIPDKGLDIVVDLAPRHPDCNFHILGGDDTSHGAYAGELRARAAGNVTFHGAIEDVGSAIDLLGAQVNLMPSRREESFGLAALEGMACSCLTITSGRGGLAEIAENTGAWTATNAEDWSLLMDRIRASSRTALATDSRGQHSRAITHYHPARFNAALDALFV